jgi:hypothetical protein
MELENKIYKKVFDFFEKDTKKTNDWFLTCNPILGGVAPIDMMGSDKKKKRLMEQIENSLLENEVKFYHEQK